MKPKSLTGISRIEAFRIDSPREIRNLMVTVLQTHENIAPFRSSAAYGEAFRAPTIGNSANGLDMLAKLTSG